MEDFDADRRAVIIYAAMGRDPTDALEMIDECTNVRTMETLHKMLTNRGTDKTDTELNKIMLGPVMRKRDKLRASR